MINIKQKLKVFISSSIENDEFKEIRRELVEQFNATNFITVYAFEQEGASTLSAREHYTFHLKDSDVCVFLIDNKEGLKPGVVEEINIAKANGILSLYYFNDEYSKEKTITEKKLIESDLCKFKTVHCYRDYLVCVQDISNDIINIYHYYSKGFLKISSQTNLQKQYVTINNEGQYAQTILPKAILNNIDKCSNYIIENILEWQQSDNAISNTSDLDDWAICFLPTMFDCKSIKNFNVDLFIDCLKRYQSESYNRVVYLRWKAIQSYFSGNIQECIFYLEKALKTAKDTQQAQWIIQDISIDIRNQSFLLNSVNEHFSIPKIQNELSQNQEPLYYPILDRIKESLHNTYVNNLFREKLSFYSKITISNDLYSNIQLLASYIIVAIFNGSLTYIIGFYEKIEQFLTFLCFKYPENNEFKATLLKYAIYNGDNSKINNIKINFSEIEEKLTDDYAHLIMEFLKNQPVEYILESRIITGFGFIGYYLNDQDFHNYECYMLKITRTWFTQKTHVIDIGSLIMSAIDRLSLRIKSDYIIEICCLFFENHYSRWYCEVFKVLEKLVLSKGIEYTKSERLLSNICNILDNQEERKILEKSPLLLCALQKQKHKYFDKIEKKIYRCLSGNITETYILETTVDKQVDYKNYLLKQFQNRSLVYNRIPSSDESVLLTARNIILDSDFICDETMLEILSEFSIKVLSEPREQISTKLTAFYLLYSIIIKYSAFYESRKIIFESIACQKDLVTNIQLASFNLFSNIDSIPLSFALSILGFLLHKNVYQEILEYLSLIQDNSRISIEIMNILLKYYENTMTVRFSSEIENIIFHKVLSWLKSENLTIQYCATKLMFCLLRNPENKAMFDVINIKLTDISDKGCSELKVLVLDNLDNIANINKETKSLIILKCKKDKNYEVRIKALNIESTIKFK